MYVKNRNKSPRLREGQDPFVYRWNSSKEVLFSGAGVEQLRPERPRDWEARAERAWMISLSTISWL